MSEIEMTFLKNQHEEYEALAQIAEMKSAEKPSDESEIQNHFDALIYNMMHDKNIAASILIEYQEESDRYWTRDVVGERMQKFAWYADALKAQIEYFNSPYTEGENE